jgi:hypothetical protein
MTFNTVVNLLRDIADKHWQINSFGIGGVDEIESSLESDKIYPKMWAVPSGTTIKKNTYEHRFNVLLMDLVKSDRSNQTEVISDMMLIANDIVKLLKYEDADYNVIGDPFGEIFVESFSDVVAGFRLEFSIEVPQDNSRCSIPTDALEQISGSTGGYVRRGGAFDCSDLLKCGSFTDLRDLVFQLQESLDNIDFSDYTDVFVQINDEIVQLQSSIEQTNTALSGLRDDIDNVQGGVNALSTDVTQLQNSLNGTQNAIPKYSSNGLTLSTLTDDGTTLRVGANQLDMGNVSNPGLRLSGAGTSYSLNSVAVGGNTVGSSRLNIVGHNNTSTNFGLTVKNLAGTDILAVRNDQNVFVNGDFSITRASVSQANTVTSGLSLNYDAAGNPGFGGITMSMNTTSGNRTGFLRMARTAGTTFNGLEIGMGDANTSMRFLVGGYSDAQERLRIGTDTTLLHTSLHFGFTNSARMRFQDYGIRVANAGSPINFSSGLSYWELSSSGNGAMAYTRRDIDADQIIFFGAGTTEALRIKNSYRLGWSPSTPGQAGSDTSIGRFTAGKLRVYSGNGLGIIQTALPTVNEDATNKLYVDNQITPITDNIITINNEIDTIKKEYELYLKFEEVEPFEFVAPFNIQFIGVEKDDETVNINYYKDGQLIDIYNTHILKFEKITIEVDAPVFLIMKGEKYE